MNYLIAGFGPAGAHAAAAIRECDPHGAIHIFSAERHPFYFRAALPHYALGHIDRDGLWAFPAGETERLGLRHHPVPLVAIDTARSVARDAGGGEHPWDRLLIACGAAPSAIGCPGESASGVVHFDTLDDAERVRALCGEGGGSPPREGGGSPDGRAIIAGGGARALALAWVARRLGMDVLLLVPEERLAASLLDAAAAMLLFRRLTDDGVEVRLGQHITGVEHARQGGATAPASGSIVVTGDGRHHPCRWLGVGTDGAPGSPLAVSAGLPEGAVEVNARLETRLPGIYAAGDVCSVREGGESLRSGGWLAAVTQGRVAGLNMAGGDATYQSSHYYHATTLYDLPAVLIGACDAAGDAAVTTHPRGPDYRRLVFRKGALIGAVLLGDRRHAAVLRRAIELQVDVRGYELQMLRTDVDLNRLLRPSGEYHLY
ncbi:MAG: NAD(P)/FAD-dependent oxidoreductase [Nitrospirota bacterium]|nr:NAD(P)/FAD-dependent oxidoreductase [Nitrospirota bacterium]